MTIGSFESSANVIFDTKSVFEVSINNPKYLASERWSPYYINLRKIPSDPYGISIITNNFVDLINKKVERKIDKITTTETAGILFASSVAYKLGVGITYVRKKPKNHGLKNLVEGTLEKGEYVIGVDDLTTTAGTAIKCIKAVRECGAKIDRYFVVFDRNEGSREELANEGIKLYSLVEMNENFINLGKDKKIITKKDAKILEEYIADPLKWSYKYERSNPEFIKKK